MGFNGHPSTFSTYPHTLCISLMVSCKHLARQHKFTNLALSYFKLKEVPITEEMSQKNPEISTSSKNSKKYESCRLIVVVLHHPDLSVL